MEELKKRFDDESTSIRSSSKLEKMITHNFFLRTRKTPEFVVLNKELLDLWRFVLHCFTNVCLDVVHL